MSPVVRRTVAILLIAVPTAFSAAPPAHAVLEEYGRAATVAEREPGRGIVAFLLRLILKTGGSDSTTGSSSSSSTTTTTTVTTTTTTTTRPVNPQDTGGTMDPNG
ncbi:MAG TPA: hypothetical protein VF789_11430 [Thermoanaerobaculia bacterium]